MVLQVGLLRESPVADRTFERPVSVVDVRMCFQVTGSREGLATEVALMRLVLAVGHPVVVEIGGGGEPLATDGALVWLFSRMDATMRVQG